jgi:hypothetical protein
MNIIVSTIIFCGVGVFHVYKILSITNVSAYTIHNKCPNSNLWEYMFISLIFTFMTATIRATKHFDYPALLFNTECSFNQSINEVFISVMYFSLFHFELEKSQTCIEQIPEASLLLTISIINWYLYLVFTCIDGHFSFYDITHCII